MLTCSPFVRISFNPGSRFRTWKCNFPHLSRTTWPSSFFWSAVNHWYNRPPFRSLSGVILLTMPSICWLRFVIIFTRKVFKSFSSKMCSRLCTPTWPTTTSRFRFDWPQTFPTRRYTTTGLCWHISRRIPRKYSSPVFSTRRHVPANVPGTWRTKYTARAPGRHGSTSAARCWNVVSIG